MPHFSLEYSRNLEEVVDMGALCEAIRASAERIETFPTAGIRVRATRADYFSMADGDPKHGFIDLVVRLREGRTAEVKKDAIQRIFETLQTFVAPAMQTRSIALSAEICDMNAEFSPKAGNVRDHLEKNA